MVSARASWSAILAHSVLTICAALCLSHRLPPGPQGRLLPPARFTPSQRAFLSFDRIRKSLDRARVENYVRDVNLQLRKKPHIQRLLVVLELGEPFSRSCRSAEGRRMLLGNSDKVSLPEDILTQLTDGNVAVPWQFVIQKVHRCDLASAPAESGSSLPTTNDDVFRRGKRAWLHSSPTTAEDGHKERLACSSLDFRPQDSFIFLPRWMMESLELQPYDVVHLSQLKLPDAVFVSIAPLESSFFELVSPKAVLEEQLKHYSTLTRGSTIPITHDGVTYHLRVLRIETEDCKDAECASIQDTDVSTDLVQAQ
ncbi:ubiquitin fusion degradation protein 1, putative [Babesia caballi]|uniref:Ubiquitin fusion degradation protein 1, putative n=1 Tax=Babesia caballi TaxID=5871 RepID=A0AAV4LRK4_BABCB|nr:ubiquitin fusion degradation protein 1, putative [Babesia caballi]